MVTLELSGGRLLLNFTDASPRGSMTTVRPPALFLHRREPPVRVFVPRTVDLIFVDTGRRMGAVRAFRRAERRGGRPVRVLIPRRSDLRLDFVRALRRATAASRTPRRVERRGSLRFNGFEIHASVSGEVSAEGVASFSFRASITKPITEVSAWMQCSFNSR